MDFVEIIIAEKKGYTEIYPDFRVNRSKDIMIKGGQFYAIWDKENNVWDSNVYRVAEIIDNLLWEQAKKLDKHSSIKVRTMESYSSAIWTKFRNYQSSIGDNYKPLDQSIIFKSQKTGREDYSSKRLPYDLNKEEPINYNKLMEKLYDPKERTKIEWGVGSILAGDSINIHKFFVLYGAGGTGKSTVLNIIQMLFQGYYTTFDAKALCTNGNSFSTEVFKSNPLVCIQHDGDLSKLDDNTKFNSIVSHEDIIVNEKFKSAYNIKPIATLWIGTNSPVKITDSKSGLIRRLIDISPTGNKFKPYDYERLMSGIEGELGAIANHCIEVYKKKGKNYYSQYKPLDMIYNTNIFFNFVEQQYFQWRSDDGVTLKAAYSQYKEYCDDSEIPYKLPMYKFREELKSYFLEFKDRARVGDVHVHSYYQGFRYDKFESVSAIDKDILTLECTESIFDKIAAEYPAQYASASEIPLEKWHNVKTKLKDIDTSKLHFVKLPPNHIVIDFDLKKNGEKDLNLNLEEAALWKPTYAELSKGGKGVHLHYIFDGDAENLSRIYSENIEIKVPVGDSSLRRKLTKCNDLKIATLKGGLPKKEVKMINLEVVRSEKGLRDLIKRNLMKEIHPGTKPSMDFIHKILEDAYNSGLVYDVTDLRPKIMTFASNSSNQADYCLKLLLKMKFKSDVENENMEKYKEDLLVFFDVEVFPNLFVVVIKKDGCEPVKLINPKSTDIEPLLEFKLVGFNCRRYDNHILYAAHLGYTNEELHILSQRIISGSPNAMFREAYNISYTDVYDFSSEKKSLKKFEIDLGIHHQELGFPWDKPVDEDKWELVVDYCVNDVVATEAVFHNRKQDWIARQILAEISGLTVNDTTQRHSAKIIFGDDKNPQSKFVYTDLSKEFPGYTFERGISTYKGEVVGEGGYVYAEPGMYEYVEVQDVASMHPSSAIYLNMFGPYTARYKELINARLAIKAGDYELAKTYFEGKLTPYLGDKDGAKELSYALKIVINIVYGLSSAKFENPFRDPRNIDNICAKRGALFMIDLKHAVQLRGYTVAHIKTDSIKIPNAKKDIIDFVYEFGKERGYEFEREKPYNRFCLVNDAVYIAMDEKCNWEAVGTQFQHPYVYKTLFSKEEIKFEDLCETKSVTTSLYLDMNETLEDVSLYEKIKALRDIYKSGDENKINKVSKSDFRLYEEWSYLTDEKLEEFISKGHSYRFVGRVGSFCPMIDGVGAGILLREKDGKYYSATGAKGYRWMEAEMVKTLKLQDKINMSYFRHLADEAISNINKYGDFETFVGKKVSLDKLPWAMPCGREHYGSCGECPDLTIEKDELLVCENGFEPIPF